ncbi:pentapeptide repeat-containing protein [Thalassomonas haliotis]|uniref:Pentapeptide repeat-containing protein n=1 Tax=Thalassomonas haliotis TaxID=485448 RepID=A0ABY7VJG5_9GAMM|nr:pentapeptide repeat-containing protein [Thalassomonas haliotis]WDE13726.1 pentapeptide repeat-containing protein [Thalassomonas haliotis]
MAKVNENSSTGGKAGLRDKTLWDWLDLLVIPAVLTFGLLWFDLAESERTRNAVAKRAEIELDVARGQARERALQMYLDKMSTLLLEHGLKTSARRDEVRSLARARTLTVLSQLDGRRKGYLLRFLYEAGLISAADPVLTLGGGILGESSVDETVLSRADLTGAVLSRLFLSGGYLTRVHLIAADLHGSNLNKANLVGTDLRDADISNASLKGAKLANADLRGANLKGADFSRANLRGAKVTAGQLSQVKSLAGATLPDGSQADE